MKEGSCRRTGAFSSLFLVFLACLALLPAVSHAQTPAGGGNDAPAEKPGAFSALMDAIDSGSRMLIDQIQPGKERDLVDNPRFNSQESPRHSLMTIVEAMALVARGHESVGYERALRSLPEGASREDARNIHEILLRLGPLSAVQLPGPRQVEESGDRRFEFFPRGADHAWVWEAADPPADAVIALATGADGRWTMTERTIEGAPDLLESLAALPPRYDQSDSGQLFLEVFAPLIQETGIIGWIAFIAVTIGAIAAGILFSKALHWAARRAENLDQRFMASTLRGLGVSGGLVVFTAIFTVAIGFLELGSVLRGLRYEIPRVFMIIASAMFIISLIDVVSAFVRERVGEDGSHYDRMVVTMIRRILRIFIIALVLMFLFQNLLGVNIGALLVGFGFVALALSLAAQDTVKNVFGAVSVFINRPFVIGDWIVFKGEAGEHIGVIKDIQLQATKLLDLNGNLITLPNMLFIDREVQNLSARGHIRREVNIAVPYGGTAEDIDNAMEAMREAFNDPDVIEDAMAKDRDGEPHVSFSDFKESWLALRGYHYYYMGEEAETQRETDRGWFSYLDHCSLVNRKIVEKFQERGLEFAFPTQTVVLEKDDPGPA
ncbi:MAG: hypothetical protein CMI63_18975 [Parvularcula sp.]|nr:hypothetical protein [Parvularcula sp.]